VGVAYHPRISVNSICSWNLPFDGDVELWRGLGIGDVGVIEPKLDAFGWDASRDTIHATGLRVSSISCYRWGTGRSLEFCPTVGADILYMVSGGYGPVPWEDAAASFCQEIDLHVSRAAELGVTLAVEPTNPLRTDSSFLHSVRDAIDLARMCGMKVVIDFYSAWYERDIESLLRANPGIVGLAQICDYRLGTFDMPNRSVPGDGDIPIERLVSSILDTGYEGPFDIEVLGPRIEEEGYRSAIARSAEFASEMLDRLGV
jgi:sugar phosphate isomerase/epimerase